MTDGIYAIPRAVTSLQDCYFYHSMEIPGWGEVRGEWDLRGGEAAYLGNVDLKDKRVLELGAASGFLSFYMERQGADVVGYDISDNSGWNMVPTAGEQSAGIWSQIAKTNNGYWLAHKAFKSKAKMVYGTVYEIPDAIGEVDISTAGSILLHLRHPFLALEKTARLTRETMVVTDLFRDPRSRFFNKQPGGFFDKLRKRFGGPALVFMPPYAEAGYSHTWWYLTPEVVEGLLKALGFGDTTIIFHRQRYVGDGHDTMLDLYTVVGRRTEPTVVT